MVLWEDFRPTNSIFWVFLQKSFKKEIEGCTPTEGKYQLSVVYISEQFLKWYILKFCCVWILMKSHVVNCYTKRISVDFICCYSFFEEIRCHEHRRPFSRESLWFFFYYFCQTKISYFELTVLNQNIVRFDVPMNNVVVVETSIPKKKISDKFPNICLGNDSNSIYVICQSSTLTVFHYDVHVVFWG